MLDGLDEIPWANLNHVFGPANDVPTWFRELLSPVPAAREMAMTDLAERIWHQGTVSDATLYAIPFLFELVERDEVKVRLRIAILLMCIADSYTGWPSNNLADQCRKLVGDKLDVLLPYIRHKDPGVKCMLLDAVSRFPDKKGLVAFLEHASEREKDADVRSAIANSIEKLRAGAKNVEGSM